MIVVSNTSPINYLILTGYIEVLPALFGEIHIPKAVVDELSDAAAPPLVRDWIVQAPSWLQVRSVSQVADTALTLLDPGEQAAILLAQELRADLVLLDDMQARRAATQKSLNLTGILGILDQAATRKLIDLPTAVKSLRNTSFWVADSLLQRLLDKHS